ncbi:uncharacterized protein A4U43_C09F8950 [Asparagus officinalis]|uniref:Uncharacterized protein n=1 Tax=Asparagus officinalis TaxID=4686 RepID=A0A5P1E6A7_ASPOF|nr:uncharacterized protein A4U43_C09F8950 [Asparagus officinalis]
MLFWYCRISLRATVPGRNRWGFLTPPVARADLRAALVASCFLGALPPVDLRVGCIIWGTIGVGTDYKMEFWRMVGEALILELGLVAIDRLWAKSSANGWPKIINHHRI